MVQVRSGRAITAVYRWCMTLEKTPPPAFERLQPKFPEDLGRTRRRLSNLLSGLESIEAGAAIAARLSADGYLDIIEGCRLLRTALEGPDFGLALALGPAVKRDLAGQLTDQADRLNKLVSGRGISIAPPVKKIAHVADLLQQGPVPISKILRVMRARMPMLEETGRHSLGLGQSPEELLSKPIQWHLKMAQQGAPYRPYGQKIYVFGNIVSGFGSRIQYANQFTPDEMELKLRTGIDRFFDFMEHPLLLLALASYVGPNELSNLLHKRAFEEGHLLAHRRPRWEWVLKIPPIEIATDR